MGALIVMYGHHSWELQGIGELAGLPLKTTLGEAEALTRDACRKPPALRCATSPLLGICFLQDNSYIQPGSNWRPSAC